MEEEEEGEVREGEEGEEAGGTTSLQDIREGEAWTGTGMREVQGGDLQDTREERLTQARIWESKRRRKRRKEGKFLLKSHKFRNLPILPLASLSIRSTVLKLMGFLQKRSLLSQMDLTSVQQLEDHPRLPRF